MSEEMSEKESREFWGELADPMTKMFRGMVLEGRYEWIEILNAMQEKAQSLKKASEK